MYNNEYNHKKRWFFGLVPFAFVQLVTQRNQSDVFYSVFRSTEEKCDNAGCSNTKEKFETPFTL
jgi:hypothetical protein